MTEEGLIAGPTGSDRKDDPSAEAVTTISGSNPATRKNLKNSIASKT
jgi:hypothetical protein